VLLPPREAVAIVMALHELCTNAVKYGALSNDTGEIELAWNGTHRADRRLELVWREHGGPAVSPPVRRGFGSLLLERTLAQDLDGAVALDFLPEGLVCRIEAPLPNIGLPH
jgi:two-component sensor histidine kinase